jgi:hypothetical protein
VLLTTVLPGESIAPQDRLLIAYLKIRKRQQRKRKRIKKTKWWKRFLEKESWFWNEEVQKAVMEK